MPKISDLPPRGEADGTELFPVLWNGQTMHARASTLFGVKGDKGDPGDKDGDALVWLEDFMEEGDASASEAFQRVHDFLWSSGDSRARLMLGAAHYHCADNVYWDKVAIDVFGRGRPMATSPNTGTWLTFGPDLIQPFKISRGAGESRGGGFHDLGLYQFGHPNLSPDWEPVDYPYIFDCEDLLGEFFLENIYCANINRLVKSVNSGRLNVRGLRGQIFRNAAYIDNCLDVARLFDWHLWSYWTSSAEILSFVQAEFDAVVMGRCDSPMVGDIFVFACNNQFKFIQTASGVTTKFTAGVIMSDFTRHGLLVESPGFTAQIDALNHQAEAWPGGVGPLADGKTIKVTQPGAMIQIGTLQGTEMEAQSISVEATGCNVNIGSALWQKINQDGAAGAIFAESGSNVFVGRYLIQNSGSTKLTAPGGALAGSALIQNELPGAVNYVFAAAGGPGINAKLYPEGPGADISLELGAKGGGTVKLIAGLQLHPLKVAELPPLAPLGTHYVVDDAANADGGQVVVGGGEGQAVVVWLRDAWRIAGGGIAASEAPTGAIVAVAGVNAEGAGVIQSPSELVSSTPAFGGLSGRVDSLETHSDEARLRAAGAPLTGAADDRPALAAMLAGSTRGLALSIARPLAMLLATQLVVADKPFALNGGAPSYSLGQGSSIEVTTADAFDIQNSDGFSVRNFHIRATGAALTGGSIFNFKASETSSSNSGMLQFDNLRIEGGYNIFTFRKVFQAQVRGVRIANAQGEYCFGHNGLNDDAQANVFEYYGCTAGGVRYSNCDLWVFDGGGGSAKMTDCAGNFGRHGMVVKSDTLGTPCTITGISSSPEGLIRISTAPVAHGLVNDNRVIIDDVLPADIITGEWPVTKVDDFTVDLPGTEYQAAIYSGGTMQKAQGRDPGFIYWHGGGYENLDGDAFRLIRGGKLQVSTAYFSTDGLGHIINQYETYKGRVKFIGCDLRAAGSHGLNLRSGNAMFVGCDIVNNGRAYVDAYTRAIESITDNGDNLIRVTTTAPHGYRTGDRVRHSRCGTANGVFTITVISSTVYDCQGSSFATGATLGTAWRLYHGITGAVNHGDGTNRIRITAPGHTFFQQHPETGAWEEDWVYFSPSSFGITGVAGNIFRAARIDADNFILTLDASGAVPTFAGAYTSGGFVQRCSAQVRIAAGSSNVIITGGMIGTDAQGINRARVAIIIEPGCTNITIDSDISLDARSAIINLSSSEPTVNIRNRRLLPYAPTPPVGDNSTRLATTAFVRNEIGQSIQGQGAILDKFKAVAPTASKMLILNSSNNAEAIDWILGGSFTPIITCATPGDLSVAYATQSGVVNKRGKLVEVTMTLVFTPTYTTASGELQIGAYPYVADAQTPLALLNFSSLSAFTWPSTATQLFAALKASQAVATIIGQKSGGTTQTGQISMFPSGTQQTLRIWGLYRSVT